MSTVQLGFPYGACLYSSNAQTPGVYFGSESIADIGYQLWRLKQDDETAYAGADVATIPWTGITPAPDTFAIVWSYSTPAFELSPGTYLYLRRVTFIASTPDGTNSGVRNVVVKVEYNLSGTGAQTKAAATPDSKTYTIAAGFSPVDKGACAQVIVSGDTNTTHRGGIHSLILDVLARGRTH